jgi:hypothetical protein
MKYRLVVTNYNYNSIKQEREGDKVVENVVENEVDVRTELYEILRMPGVYADGVETCDGVALAANVRACEEDHITITEREHCILKRIFNKLIQKEHRPMARSFSLGGDRYIPLIQRVFRAEEVKD